MTSYNRNWIFTFVVFLVSAGLLAACGDGGKKSTNEIANWLTGYSKSNQPNKGIWQAVDVTVDGDRIVMNVFVPNRDQERKIRSLRIIDQARVAQYACPPANTKVWPMLGHQNTIWISLNSHQGFITGTTCKN